MIEYTRELRRLDPDSLMEAYSIGDGRSQRIFDINISKKSCEPTTGKLKSCNCEKKIGLSEW